MTPLSTRYTMQERRLKTTYRRLLSRGYTPIKKIIMIIGSGYVGSILQEIAAWIGGKNFNWNYNREKTFIRCRFGCNKRCSYQEDRYGDSC